MSKQCTKCGGDNANWNWYCVHCGKKFYRHRKEIKNSILRGIEMINRKHKNYYLDKLIEEAIIELESKLNIKGEK